MSVRPSECIATVRAKAPLVQHITNDVTINDCANICLCAGGRPVMTKDTRDSRQMAECADALVLNIGTVDGFTLEAMIASGTMAKSRGIPVVFDPVGVGSTQFRNESAMAIIRGVHPDIIKGNAGEIAFLAGKGSSVRGVDGSDGCSDMSEAVSDLASKYGCIVVATGAIDYISDGKETVRLQNGTPMEDMVSGAGCMLASVVACYVAACGRTVDAVASAISIFNIAAEDAAMVSEGPGSFKVSLMDRMSSIRDADDRVRASSVRR